MSLQGLGQLEYGNPVSAWRDRIQAQGGTAAAAWLSAKLTDTLCTPDLLIKNGPIYLTTLIFMSLSMASRQIYPDSKQCLLVRVLQTSDAPSGQPG